MVLIWEAVKSEVSEKGFFAAAAPSVLRAKVPGGWFIRATTGAAGSTFFYPDPEHTWDGSSLP